MTRLAAVAVLLGIGALALGTACVVIGLRRLRWSPEPVRCPVCGALARDHYAQTTWQPGGVDA